MKKFLIAVSVVVAVGFIAWLTLRGPEQVFIGKYCSMFSNECTYIESTTRVKECPPYKWSKTQREFLKLGESCISEE